MVVGVARCVEGLEFEGADADRLPFPYRHVGMFGTALLRNRAFAALALA